MITLGTEIFAISFNLFGIFTKALNQQIMGQAKYVEFLPQKR